MSLNFDSPEPLHTQLKKKLKEDILKGCYKKKIPSERVLMDRFSVSRTTVRMAVSMLVNEGILEKSHGKGTFISSTPVQDWLGAFKSFTETIENAGMTPSSKLLFQGIVSPPRNIGEALEVEKCYLIERLRFADDLPIAIEKHFYSVEIGKELEKYDLNSVVIYDVLENKLGINLWKAKQSIKSGTAIKHDAENLSIPEASSVLLSERTIYDPEGRSVEFLKSIFRSDMYTFNIEMMRAREK
ncbi:GntR family transcriptional regulator [Virgibacillus halophilus]|uniref:GntR family transcriptional regulator n=1 Tax=Tigheibacillus halophilus TaxID=361280 RepID=A0ABU5C2R6_9BACI|nr:GntR family transcriptional regulator [Virgibacillus halophilus]